MNICQSSRRKTDGVGKKVKAAVFGRTKTSICLFCQSAWVLTGPLYLGYSMKRNRIRLDFVYGR